MARQRLSNEGARRREEKIAHIARQFTSDFDLGTITIKAAFNLFKGDQETKGNSKQTIVDYKRMYDKVLIPVLNLCAKGEDTLCSWLENDDSQLTIMQYLKGEFPLKEDMAEINPDYISPYWDKEVSVQTINHYLRSYRTFGNFCLAEGYILFFQCYIKEIEPPVKDVYSEADIKKLLKKPNPMDFIEYRNYTIISLLLSTGARCNTILNLRIKDIDFDNGYIAFNILKNNHTELIPLHPQTQKDLFQYVTIWRNEKYSTSPDDYLFCNDYMGKMTRDGLYKTLSAYNKARGVKKTGIHLFRHTLAKNWIKDEGDIISLAKVLTHQDLTMVKRYSNLYSGDLKEKVKQHSTMAQVKKNSGTTMRTKGKQKES